MFGKEKKAKRFVVKEEEALCFGAVYIVVDTKTGVNYIMTVGTGINALTPLLDSDGSVVVDNIIL